MIEAQCRGFINTPPLWEKKQFNIQQFEFPPLDMQHFKPKALLGNFRLGHQMEYVFKQLVAYSNDYKIILHNLQICQEKRTLGEIDFILENTVTQKVIHVELTYKFYIINPEIPEPIHRLIGPNRRDSFFMKMRKIKNVQFPLLHSDEGAKALYSHNVDHLNIEHQCCFKAQLFKPYGSGSIDIGLLNKDCLAGFWLRIDDFDNPEFANLFFYLPTKSEWVIKPIEQVTWKSHDEILIDLNRVLLKERAPMIWFRKSITEIERLFVVWW